MVLLKELGQGQSKLKMHRDISILSFNVLLNEASDFDGGGTKLFKANKVIEIQKGEVAMHSGRLYHSGREVTRGVRYIMVGFIGIKGDRVNDEMRKATYKRSVTDDEMLYNMLLY